MNTNNKRYLDILSLDIFKEVVIFFQEKKIFNIVIS